MKYRVPCARLLGLLMHTVGLAAIWLQSGTKVGNEVFEFEVVGGG